MILNYNSLNSGRDTWFKKGDLDGMGAPPNKASGSFNRWMVVLFVAFVALFNSFSTNAQTQVGVTATGGTLSASYATLGAAFTAINAGTHTGTLVLSITANTTETAACVLNSSGAGSASYTSVLIRPTADGVSISGPTVTGRGLIELNGADNVTIDGDNPNTGGINRNLTIANTAANTVTYTSVIRIAVAATVVTSADNDVVKNCIITGSAGGAITSANTSATTGGVGSTNGILVSGGASTVAATTAPTAISSNTTTTGTTATALNFTATNNQITACGRGICVSGSAVTVVPLLTITNNLIGNATAGATTGVAWKGISAQGFGAGSTISGNTVYVESWISTSPYMAGIELGGVSAVGTGAIIEKNTIARVYQNNTGGWGSYGINLVAGNANTVRNNFIYNVKNIGSGSFSPTYTGGIRIGAGLNHLIYHNTVNLYGSDAGTGNLQACLSITATTLTGIDIRNNIFSNTMTSASTSSAFVCLYLPSAGTSAMNLTLNNNAYYSGSTAGLSAIAQVGITYGTGVYTAANFAPSVTTGATNLRTYTSSLLTANTNNDNASFGATTAAPFTSATDLHLNTGVVSTPLESAGASVGLTTDFDGQTRPGPTGSVNGGATAPDLGADEFDGKPLVLCATPAAAPTALVLSPGSTSVGISFTAAAADGYLVIRTTGAAPTAPTDATNYTLGASALGGTIAYVGALTTGITDNSSVLTSTAYSYYVYSYNNSNCTGGPKYSTSNLSGATTTCITAPVASAATVIAGTSFTANWAASAGATSYLLDVSTSNTFASFLPSYNGVNVGNVTSISVTGLSGLTTYYYRVRATTGSCTTSNSATITTATLGAIPWTEGFTGITTTPTGWTTTGYTIGTTTGVTGNPANAMYVNMYSSNTTSTFTTPTFGNVPSGATFGFQYNLMNWNTTTAVTGTWGTIQYQISVNGGAFANFGAAITAVTGTGYVSQSLDLTPYAGSNIQIRMNATWTAGDYNLSFDNFSILSPCVTPASPTALVQGATGPGTIAESFIPNATAPDGYMVVRYANGAAVTAPVNGTVSYAAGQALGLGTISNVVSGAGSSFTISGLAPSTSYDVYVYPYTINSCIGGPVFGAALSGTAHSTTGCPAIPTNVTVGATGDYPTLSALALILNGCPISNPVLVELQSNYNPASETLPIVFNNNSGTSGTNTVTIRPAAGAGPFAISGSSTSALLDLNGARYFTFDGRAGGIGASALSITNTGNGAALRLFNDAQNNTIQSVALKSSNTSATNGVVRITSAAGTALTNGNNNNTITGCTIDGNGVSPNGIYAAGSTAPADNKSNVISNNAIFNYYSDVAATNNYGIFLGGNNGVSASAAWTISGNSFYQTASRAFASNTGIISAIGGGFNPAGALNITGNFIGGTAASAGGTAQTLTGAAAYIFTPINVLLGGADASTISGNTIANYNVTTASTSTTNALITASTTLAGNTVSIANNTLGSASTAGSVSFTGGAASVLSAISVGSYYGSQLATNFSITGNTIAGIALPGTTNANSFRGINIGSAVTATTASVITGNTIGAAAAPISNASTGTSTGILNGNAIGSSIRNNTVSYLTASNVGTAVQLVGISTTAGSNVIGSVGGNGNTIANFTSAAANTGTAGAASVLGISQTSTTAGQSVASNKVSLLANTGTGAATVTGIYFSGPTSGTNEVNNNLVHTLSATTAASAVNGIQIADSGNATVYNNILRLGLDAAGAAFTNDVAFNGINQSSTASNHGIYFNTVYLGGSVTGASNTFAITSAATSGTRAIRNNVITNIRTTASGLAKHYAIKVTDLTGLTINNNDYWTGSTSTLLALNNATDATSLLAWQASTTQDGGSISVDPNFINPTAAAASFDLHITAGVSSALESGGAAIAGITTDYDSQVRPGPAGSVNGGALSSDMGADEFDGIPGFTCSALTGLTAVTTNATVCGNTAILSVAGSVNGTGITYQWQVASTQLGTYSNIAGATFSTYAVPTTSVSSNWYQCVVTCANGPVSAIAAAVNVTVQACNYAVTRNTSVPYNSIITTGSTYTSLSSSDDGFTNFVPLTGTTFKYRGQAVTQFFATSNGTMSFSSTQNTHTGYGDLTTSTAGKDLMLAPYWTDFVIKANSTANLNASMRYQINGTLGSGSADIIIEWAEMEGFSFTNPNMNFQVVLHESNNSIEYNYGSMLKFDGAANSTGTFATVCAIGLNGNSPATADLSQRLILQNANSTNFGTTSVTNLLQTPACNSQLVFTPAVAYSGGAAPATVPANNELAGAFPLTVNGAPCTSNCGISYYSLGATASAGTTVCSATTPGTADDDVWFTFTPSSTTPNHKIVVTPSFGYDAVVQLIDLFDNSVVQCVNAAGVALTETISSVTLNQAHNYALRIYDAGTGAFGGGEFSVCVSEIIAPPVNDDPAGAIALTVGSTCTPTSSLLPSTLAATATAGVTACTATTPGTADDDVWYKFTTGSSAGLTYNMTATGVSTYNAVLQLFSGTPGALTSVACANANNNGVAETITSSTLTANTTYYLRVYHSGTGAANGNFTICVSVPAPVCVTTPTAPANASAVCLSATATTLSWATVSSATAYDVYLDNTGGTSTTPVSANQTALTYVTPSPLAAGTYTWRVVPKNDFGSATACTNFTFSVSDLPTTATNGSAATICSGGNVVLSGNAPTSGTGSWSVLSGPSTAAAQFANVADPATTFTPTASGTYVVRWSITACSVSTADATITVNGTPTALTVIATGGGCENDVVTLTATGGAIPTSPVTLGTQSTTEFGGGVYRYGYGTGDFRHQMLYTKAELNAAGITGPTSLTGIAFTVTSVGSGSANNYAISLANTPATVLSTTFETTSLTPVYNAATYTAVSGVNTHTFTTPFAWDGTSNVLVNICYTVATLGGSSTLAATTPTALSNSNLLGSAGACTATTAAGTFANRPLATFAYLGNAPVNWTTSPSATLYTAPAANAGTEYVAGSNARVVYARPAAGTTTYNATAKNGTCESAASTTFTPNALPIIAGIANTTICNGTGTTLTVTPESGTTYTWYKDAVLPGNIVASVSGFPNQYFANPTVSTTYYVKATNNTFGCQSIQSVLVSVNNAPGGSVSPSDNNVSEGSGADFTVNATGTVSGYQWQVLVPASVANPTPDWTDVSGATGANLNLTAVTLAMNTNQYRCVVKGTAPCGDFTTDPATLNVRDIGFQTVNQPQSQNLCFVSGSTPITISAQATSNPAGAAFDYQWSVDDGISGFQDILDGPSATLPGINFTGGTTSNVSSTTVSSGPLTLSIPDFSATGVQNILAVSGVPVGATVARVEVTYNLSHASLHDAEVVLTAPNGKTIALAANQGTSTAGNYTNTVITSNPAYPTLSSDVAPFTGVYQADAAIAANLIGSFGTNLTQTFSDLFSTPNGNWTIGAYDDTDLNLGTLDDWSIKVYYTLPTPAVLTMTGYTQANSGLVFKCTANGFVPSNTATILLSQGPTFDLLATQPVDRTVCSSGTTSAAYTVTALNASTYQWQVLVPVSVANPTPVWTNVNNAGIYSGATSATLTVSNAPLTADGNQYKCIVTGVSPCNTVTIESTPRFLYINNPTVATPPANATVLAGATATFTATTAAASPTYDWQYSANGTTGWASIAALPAGFTYDTSVAGTLGVTTPTTATAGNYFYRVVVTSGGCPSAPSSAATLTVNNYCASVPSSNDGSGVTRVDLQSSSFTIADVTYADNTATPVDVTQSFSTSVLVTFATGFTYDSNIWIDFNNDGDFFDAGELVKSGTSLSTSPTTLDLTFNLPVTAPLGQHRMRIGTADSGQVPPNPCYSSSFGVTLDFTVNVLPAPACAGTPVAGTVTTPNATGCAGGTFPLTLNGYTTGVSGLVFQWYGRTLPAGTFAAISGATDITYSPVVSVASEFYCTVTCANGGSPAQSNTVGISVVNCDYAVTRNTGITYNSIITTGSTYTSISSADDGYTNFVPLTGTTFKYRGSAVTQFFATSNGTMSFSSTQNTHTGYGDLTTSTAGKDLMLAPFWTDLVLKGNTTTNRDLSMRYKVNGTLGSGTADIIIEWAEMEGFGFTNPNLNFQVVLHESDNSIEYNYGNMLKFDGLANSTGTIATTCAIGLNGNSPSTATTQQRLILQNANTSNFGTTSVTNIIQTPECNSQLRFVPAAAYSGGSAPAASQANDAATSAAIAATATTLPVNDNPCASQCGTIYSSKNATATTGLTVCSATTAGNADDDVFFKFTSAVGTFNYRIQVQSSFSYDAVVQVLDSSLTPVACSNATGTGLTELITGLSLNSNQVYYLRIYDAGTGSGGSGEFAVCISKVVPPPAFDEPAGALTLNVGTTCSPTNSVIADVLNSTATTGVQTCSAATPGSPTADVWYKFTTGANVTGLTHTITVTGVSTYNPVLQVFPALPTLTNALTCVNATTNGQAETYSSSTLLANTTYYVRVYNSGGGAANGNFNICVSSTPSCVASPTAPANASSACISGSGTTLSWAAATNAQSYDVYLDSTGGTSVTPVSSNQAGLTYTTPAALAAGTYTWRVVPRNVYGAASACTNFTFTVNPTPSLTGVAQAATVCPSTNATINLSGLIANSTSTITYTIGAGAPVNVTGVVATGTTASFTVPVVFANNGQVLTITNITRTNVPTNCSFVPTSNNTVTLSVYNTYPFYVDTDHDTYGTGSAVLLCSTSASVAPTGYSVNNLDCNDNNGSIWRNGTFYVDADGDGYNNGAPSVVVCYGGTNPVGYTPSNIGTDCLDSNFEVNPNHVEVMGNGIDDNCDGAIDEVAPTTALQVSQCGSTLTNLSQAIYASQVIGAQGYRFEVTEVGNPANVRTYDAVGNSFNLSNLSGGANYNTTYSIRVAVKTAPGFWRSYSTTCTVTTPAVAATTNVSFPACGITLSNIATTIYCDAVSNATGYRFRVTDGVTTSTFDTTVNRFNLTNVNANFGTTYTVDVQLRFGTTWETTWGSVCSFTTPATPGTSNVIAAQCGVNITNLWATIYATQISVATGYRFEVTKSGGGTVFYDTPNARFSLRNITVPGFTTTNSSYSIRVSILYNSIYQPFGSACTITTNGASRVTSTPVDVFEVKAYPNPFAANFKLEINTSSENNVGVKVYDMIGREIEVRESSLSQMTTLEIGDLYPTGVYNIVVTQGDKVKTLRVIKR